LKRECAKTPFHLLESYRIDVFGTGSEEFKKTFKKRKK